MPAEIRLALDREAIQEATENRRKDVNGHLHIRVSNISKATVNSYLGSEIPNHEALGLDPNRVYQLFRDPEELQKGASSFAGKPLLAVHIPVSAEDHKREATVGSVGSNVEFKHPYLLADLVVWDGAAIAGIESGEQRELSSAYRYEADMTPGTYEGKAYDGVMRNIQGNHVALVEQGRAGSDVVVGDSAPNLPTNADQEIVIMKLSPKALVASGALRTYLVPKLARDSKPADVAKALNSALSGVTAKNFKAKKAAIKATLENGLKDKLAQDADLEDVKDVLDRLDDVADEVVEVVEAATDPANPDNPDRDRVADDADDDEIAKVKAILDGKVDDDTMAAVLAALTAAPDDAAQDDKAGKKPGAPAKPAVVKPAMDEAAVRALTRKAADDARRETIAQIAEMDAAKEAVRPHVGEVKISAAMDSAEKIYRFALEAQGIELDGIHPSAFGTMVKMLPKPSASPAREARVAMDAAGVKGFADRYPNAAPIKTL